MRRALGASPRCTRLVTRCASAESDASRPLTAKVIVKQSYGDVADLFAQQDVCERRGALQLAYALRVPKTRERVRARTSVRNRLAAASLHALYRVRCGERISAPYALSATSAPCASVALSLACVCAVGPLKLSRMSSAHLNGAE